MLEKVRFRLFGNEKEGVAEIRLEGDEYYLRLFNEKLASYYSVKIPSADLISTQPLGSVVSEQITQQRSELVREREVIRAERREMVLYMAIGRLVGDAGSIESVF